MASVCALKRLASAPPPTGRWLRTAVVCLNAVVAACERSGDVASAVRVLEWAMRRAEGLDLSRLSASVETRKALPIIWPVETVIRL